MNGNGRGEGILSERMLLTQNYVIIPPHSFLPLMVLADAGFASQNQNFLPWGFGSHTLRSWGSIKPYSSHVPLFLSLHSHRQTNGTVIRPSCHVMDLCLGVTGEGAGLPAQAKYLALNSCPWGKKKQ